MGILYLAVQGEHRLKVFENNLLKGIFQLKREAATGGWRKLNNEKLYNFYSSPDTIRITDH
jgi:hypothetical protein